jgi:hypothetical protein
MKSNSTRLAMENTSSNYWLETSVIWTARFPRNARITGPDSRVCYFWKPLPRPSLEFDKYSWKSSRRCWRVRRCSVTQSLASPRRTYNCDRSIISFSTRKKTLAAVENLPGGVFKAALRCALRTLIRVRRATQRRLQIICSLHYLIPVQSLLYMLPRIVTSIVYTCLLYYYCEGRSSISGDVAVMRRRYLSGTRNNETATSTRQSHKAAAMFEYMAADSCLGWMSRFVCGVYSWTWAQSTLCSII